MSKRSVFKVALVLAIAGLLLLGCGGAKEAEKGSQDGQPSSKEGFPAKDPTKPFALDEKGTVTLTNDQEYEIVVQRAAGGPLFTMSVKKTSVIDPQVDFTIQTIQPELPADLAAKYVPIHAYALEMYAVDELGYGFSLRPRLQITFTDEEIAGAKQNGAATDPLKSNLLVLYKEQRSPNWIPQVNISLDEATQTVILNNVASSGAWWLVAKKGQ